MSGVVGVCGLGSRTVCHAQFGKRVRKHICWAVGWALANLSVIPTVGFSRTNIHTGLSRIISIEEGCACTFNNTFIDAGIAPSWWSRRRRTFLDTCLRGIVGIAENRASFDASPGDILCVDGLGSVTYIHTVLDIQLAEVVGSLRAHIHTESRRVVRKLDASTARHDHTPPYEFVHVSSICH